MNDFDQMIGQTVDGYLIKEQIGAGGMANVYLAHEAALDRSVALKIMLPTLAQDKEFGARFRREGQAIARLNHPNIVQVYNTGVTPDGLPYLAMQYIQGGSLHDRLTELAGTGDRLPVVTALSLIRQLADALHTAHQAGIVHRDIKPTNILLHPNGTPVLTDLGIAAIEALSHLTRTGAVLGTPHYMSPEQSASQPVDGRSDIYSLGVILYELLAGERPFIADSPLGVLHQHLYDPPPPIQERRPDIALPTQVVVETCLQKEPADRFQSAAHLIAALDEALAAEGGRALATIAPPAMPADPDHSGHTPTRRRRNGRPWLVGGAILALLLITGAIWGIGRWRGESATEPEAPATSPTVENAAPAPTVPSPNPETAATNTLRPTSTLQPSPTAAPTQLPAPTAPPATTAVTALPVLDTSPASLLAYTCKVGENPQVFFFDPATGARTALANQPLKSFAPAFSRDSSQIAYRGKEAETWQIYVSRLDGVNRQQITTGGENNYEPFWSPDGVRFVFVSDRSGTRQLYVMDRDGRNQRRLTYSNVYDDDPSWSVTNVIAYESNRDGPFGVYTIDPEGSEPQLLIRLKDGSTTPAWSPDGQQIAFEVREGDFYAIWIADANGDNPQPVATQPNSARPAWSPDGGRIAFHSNYQQSDPDLWDIWIVTLSSGALERITFDGACVNPAWGRAQMPAAVVATRPAPCALADGDTAVAGDNARLWTEPDVTAGTATAALEPGTAVTVAGDPAWGPIRRDAADQHGWWWPVIMATEQSGWVWERRLETCAP